MSRFVDAGQLALTKLKTRRVRLAVTIIISSILFCLLLGVSFTVQGTLKSIDKFRGTGFSSRYIVSSYPLSSPYDLIFDKSLIAKAKDLQKKMIERKKAEAKRLGIEYDSSSEIPYVEKFDQGFGDQSEQLNAAVPEVAALLAEKVKEQPGTQEDYEKVVKDYGATATYSSVMIGPGFFTNGPPSFPYINPLQDGKENFAQASASPDMFGPNANNLNSISSQWQLFSSQLLKPFMLQNQSLEIGDDGSVPVIAPYTAVEQAVGLKPLPATAKSKERLARLKEVREKAAGYKFDVCYRNQASNDQIQQAQQQQQEIAANKSKKDYQVPDLVYDLPAQTCGPAVVTRDKRSAQQKKYDANLALFNKKFGQADPESKILRLRIVGINTDVSTGSSISVTEIFRSILSSSLGQGWASPIELTEENPTITKIFNANSDGAGRTLYAEFENSAQVEKIMKEQACEPDFSVQFNAVGNQPYKKCLDQGKYFGFSAFGSSSVAIDQFRRGFDKVFLIVGIAISVIAAIILMGTIGRIIADSRRETAVFRAIGAKRRDIAQIYLIYTIAVALLIALTSTVFGFLISQFIDNRYSSSVTVDALVAFNISDLTQEFSMSSLYAKGILYITGLIIAAALLASLLPLLNNLRRNPIKDMRDER